MEVYYGVCYYPEHYEPPHRIKMINTDIKLMKEMQFNVVRIGEFMWCELEPEEGNYDFTILDEAIELLGSQGIYTVLCMPTAAPPVWLSHKYPEIRYINSKQAIYPYGGRRFTCYNSSVYSDMGQKIVRAIAERYGNNPYVIGFQVDNEFAQEKSGRCHCENCKSLFHKWLENKYGSISNLNEKWGTIFWGQKYSDFEQILPPVTTVGEIPQVNSFYQGVDSPSLRLDFEHFCSESIISYYNIQYRILKKYTDKPITTNGTGAGTNEVDYYRLFENSDVVGVDHYPATRTSDKIRSAFEYAFARGIANDDFWLLETLCGGGFGNWAFRGMRHEYPGGFKNNILFAYASGARLITMFKLHAFKWGFEQLGSSIIDLDRTPRRRFYEFKEAGYELEKLRPVLKTTTIQSKAAVVFDYDSLWASKIKPIHPEFDYISYLQEIFRTIEKCNISVDVISKDADFSAYDLLVIPALTIMDKDTSDRIKRYAEVGGTVLATFTTGVRNEYGNGTELEQPIYLDDLFGMHISEVEPVFDDIPCFVTDLHNVYPCRLWVEQLELVGAVAVLSFKGTYRSELPAASVHSYGKGRAYYLGCGLSAEAMAEFMREIIKSAGIKSYPIRHSENVYVVERSGEGGHFLFVFNNAEQPERIYLEVQGEDFLNKQPVCGDISLEAKQYCVIKLL